MPAVCHNLNCDFTYVPPVGEVKSFTFDNSTNKLVITGESLPKNISDISTIEFAKSLCTIDNATLSDTNVECTLDLAPTCGLWQPILISKNGTIPNNAAVKNDTIYCSLTGIKPENSLNLIGGDNLTFSGAGFPRELHSNTVELEFDDAQKTKCVPQVSSYEKFVCLTDRFDKSASSGKTHKIKVTINSLVVQQDLSLEMKTEVKSGLTLAPNSVSPVLKNKIKIQIDTNFPYTLSKDEFSVNATQLSNNTVHIAHSLTKQLNVVEVDDAAKTITVLFGGAYSGKYQIKIRHLVFGLLNTDGIILDVGAYVTSVSPLQGSIYGGTLLTIKGSNFGNVYTDNPVQISFLGAIGSRHCFVEKTGPTEIQCRIDSSEV